MAFKGPFPPKPFYDSKTLVLSLPILCVWEKNHQENKLQNAPSAHSWAYVIVQQFWLLINENLATEMKRRCCSLYLFAFWECDQKPVLLSRWPASWEVAAEATQDPGRAIMT